jgi:tyrosyl-tRNA synthetase
MPVIKIPHCERVDLIEIMVESGIAKTKNEARRLIKQKAVKIDGKVQDSFEVAYNGLKSDAVFQVGSRKFFKLLK